MIKYKYENIYEWLEEYAKKLTHEELLSEFLHLAISTDPDDLQDIFQSDMESDGYFDPISEEESEEEE